MKETIALMQLSSISLIIMSLFKKIFSKTPQIDEENPITKSIFETHSHKIYPWVKVFFIDNNEPDNAQSQIEFIGEDAPIKRDWLSNLCILYVADMENTFQVLLERDLPKNITKEQLHQIAINNLNRDIEFKIHDANFGGYMLTAGGDHEAGSICLPEIWDWLTEHLNDNLIVGIPAKDLVILVPESDTDKIANLKISIHQIFKDGKRLLTRNIFRFDRVSREWSFFDTVQ